MEYFYLVLTQKITNDNQNDYKIAATFLEKLCLKDYQVALHSFSINKKPSTFTGHVAIGFPRKYKEKSRYKVFKFVCNNSPRSIIDSINNLIGTLYKDLVDETEESNKNIKPVGDFRTKVNFKPRIYFDLDSKEDEKTAFVVMSPGEGLEPIKVTRQGKRPAPISLDEGAELQAPFHIKLLGKTATALGFDSTIINDVDLIKDLIEKERPGTPFTETTDVLSTAQQYSTNKVSKLGKDEKDDDFCYIYCKIGKPITLLNNAFCNLLGVFNLNNKNTNTTVEIKNPLYIPINSDEISNFELQLFNSNNEKITLHEGTSVFVLHFKYMSNF